MKRHTILAGVLLAFSFSAAASAAEIAYIPSLPGPIAPVIPMIPSLPSRITEIVPGLPLTRSLPGYPNGAPSLRLPTISFPGPLSRSVSLPGVKEKRSVSLPPTAVATGKIIVASRAADGSAKALEELFDGSKSSKNAPVAEDDSDEIGAVKGDSSHLTLPESDLEREIGLR